MTTAVASISVTLEPDDNWTVVTVRRQDDLPAHVKSSSLGRGAVWSTEPQNKPPSYKCNISGTLQAVEFINDAWYLLAYSALYSAYRTRVRDCTQRKQIQTRLVDRRRTSTTKLATTTTTNCSRTTTISISQPQQDIQSTTRIL